MTFFNQWTGIDALNMFSNRLLTKMNDGSDNVVSANFGTILFGFMNFFGAACAYFFVKSFGRVQVLLWAHLVMGITQIILAVCIIYEQNLFAIILILIFIFTFQISEGPILWIYSAEVCHDSAFGIVVLG